MDFRDFLKNNIVLLDGSMGTLLQSKGLKAGELPERWNIEKPEVISDIHRAYFEAGSNVVCTNTFGASVLKFSEAELEEIIKAAINNAKTAAAEGKNRFVALDIGPLGKLLKPLGDLDFEAAEGFEFVLVGADGSIIERVTSAEDGKFEFTALVFDEEGTYTFIIREVVGNNEDIIYDDSVYTITVTVTKDAEELKASYTVVKGEEAYEGDIEFNNETIVEIPEEDPPYDDIPKTGDNTVIYMMVIAGTFVVFNVLLKSRRRKVD